MPRPLCIDPSQNASIYAAFKAGEGYSEIAKRLGVNTSVIWRIVRVAAVEAREPVPARQRKQRTASTSKLYAHPDAPAVVYIQTSRGALISIDPDMAPRLLKYSWSVNADGYAVTYFDGSFIYLHRLVMGVEAAGLITDHKSGDRLDNRRCNLRAATPAQNAANSGPRKGREFKGVYALKDGKWMASIRVGGKQQRIGKFDTQIEAARAFNGVAKATQGEYAWLNPV